MQRKINEQITIEYNERDVDYIDIIIQYFIDNYIKVMNTFGIKKLDKNLKIKLYSDSETFRNELEKKTGNKIPFWVVGSSKNNKNDTYSSIDCLSLLEVKKIENYENETIDDLKKTIVHEFVHICHNQFCNYVLLRDDFIKEGIATFLANQYEGAQLTEEIDEIINGKFVSYNNYRCIFDILMGKCSLGEIRKILMGDKTIVQLKLINEENKHRKQMR